MNAKLVDSLPAAGERCTCKECGREIGPLSIICIDCRYRNGGPLREEKVDESPVEDTVRHFHRPAHVRLSCLNEWRALP